MKEDADVIADRTVGEDGEMLDDTIGRYWDVEAEGDQEQML